MTHQQSGSYQVLRHAVTRAAIGIGLGLVIGSALTLAPVREIPAANVAALGNGGMVYSVADCRQGSRSAAFSVTVRQPSTYQSTGLYFYVQTFAKARFETSWVTLDTKYTSLVKTWTKTSSGVWMNNPKVILNSSFVGNVPAYYDMYVYLWYRASPTAKWSGPIAYFVKNDPNSTINEYSADGYAWQASDCWLA